MDTARPNFGRYQLIRRVSLGGMAEIYKAKAFGPTGFEKIVAVKRLLPHAEEDPELVRRFVAEARLLAQLDHPLIARTYEVGQVPGVDGRAGCHYLAMEYVYGVDLQELQRALGERGGPADPRLVCVIGILAARALAYAHGFVDASGTPLHIVHRDVSPQNLMLSSTGELKLIDFGIAKFAGSDVQTASGVVKGKHAYMSPEQVRARQVDHRSDLFSLGVILWELVCGQRLFKGESVLETLELVDRARVDAPADRMPDTPPALSRWIVRCLARDPADRPDGAAELAAGLEEVLAALDPAAAADPIALLADTYRELFGDVGTVEDEVTVAEYMQALRAVELGEDDKLLQRQPSDITIVPDTSDLAAYVARLRELIPVAVPAPPAPVEPSSPPDDNDR
ncbi:MAG: serine/threonine protein kinase [Deltaproteobacteria bacterium]|nr:serine/threonine protein kinase [Deltaproteobacteria bacterium]